LLGWSESVNLIFKQNSQGKSKEATDLGVFAAFEEGSNTNESNIIIPHHNVILVISRNFENVLEDCIDESVWVTGRDRCLLTFEAFSTCLLKKAFLLTVIRNMTRVILDLTKRVDLKFLDFAHCLLVQTLKRRKIDLSLNLTLGENCAVLSHLLFLDRRLS
jgi:hypothetical protein